MGWFSFLRRPEVQSYTDSVQLRDALLDATRRHDTGRLEALYVANQRRIEECCGEWNRFPELANATPAAQQQFVDTLMRLATELARRGHRQLQEALTRVDEQSDW